MNSWKLELESLGKLKNIELTVTPFMIFVGENNSGKSYLMEFLWGVLSQSDKVLDEGKYLDFFQEEKPQYYPINKKQKLNNQELKKINNYLNKE